MNFASNVDLTEAALPTNRGPEHLNPRTERFFARVNRVLFPVVVGVGAGAAVAVGIDRIINSYNTQISNNNTSNSDFNGLMTTFD